jgi:hypothetical protein
MLMHNTYQVMARVVFYVQAYKVVPVRNLALRIKKLYGVEVHIHSFLDPFAKWIWVVTFVLGETFSIRCWMKCGVRTLGGTRKFLAAVWNRTLDPSVLRITVQSLYRPHVLQLRYVL